jgi:glycosyltransferase involved in cell wall biosynthesis
MPQIVVDLERLRELHCGLGQFALNLGAALVSKDAANDFRFTFLMPPEAKSLISGGEFDILPPTTWRREVWQRTFRPLVLPFAVRRRADLWHMTHQDSRYWPLDPRVPMVLTVHDLNFLREKSPMSIRRRLRGLQAKVDRAAVVTTISEFVVGELREHLNLRGKPVTVVYNGATPGRAHEAVRPIWLPPSPAEMPFLFTIGDITPKKNFHVLLDLIERLPDRRLVIAGNKTSPYAQSIAEQIHDKQLDGRVFLPGKVSDGERYWLYQHCEAFLFPSKTEGFGLPVIEAMSLGRPVFLSHATSLPEIAGEHGFYWHSFDPDDMARVFNNGMTKFNCDQQFAARLQSHAGKFTWTVAAAEYLDVYRRVLRRPVERSAA